MSGGALGLALAAALAAAEAPCDRARADAAVAEALAAASDPQRVAEKARVALALCDAHAGAHNALGSALEAAGDVTGAEAEYRRAAVLEPRWYLPWLGIGDLARGRRDLEAAGTAYQEALARVGEPSERDEVVRALNEVRKEQGDFTFKTSDDLVRSLRLDGRATPNDARAWAVAAPVDDFYAPGDGLAANLSILFDVGSDEPRPEGRRQLDEIAAALARAGKTASFRVEGHASSEGDAAANLDLSRRRAERVRAYLLQRSSLDGSRLTAVGHGSERPVLESGVENRRKSRRVALVRKFDQ